MKPYMYFVRLILQRLNFEILILYKLKVNFILQLSILYMRSYCILKFVNIKICEYIMKSMIFHLQIIELY